MKTTIEILNAVVDKVLAYKPKRKKKSKTKKKRTRKKLMRLAILCALVLSLIGSAHAVNQESNNPAKSGHDQTPPQNLTPQSKQAHTVNITIETDTPDNKSKNYSPELWVTCILAFFTFCQAVFMGWTVYVMRDTARRQLRAYVLADQANRYTKANEIYGAHIQVHNSGQTPAHEVMWWVAIGIREFPLKTVLPVLQPGTSATKMVLPAGIPTEIYANLDSSIDVITDKELRKGSKGIYVYGKVTYRDIFNKYRFSTYRLVSCGGAYERGRFFICEEGNEAT